MITACTSTAPRDVVSCSGSCLSTSLTYGPSIRIVGTAESLDSRNFCVASAGRRVCGLYLPSYAHLLDTAVRERKTVVLQALRQRGDGYFWQTIAVQTAAH